MISPAYSPEFWQEYPVQCPIEQDGLPLFCEDDINWDNQQLKECVFNAIGLFYRQENRRRAWSNVRVFESLWGLIYNLFWHNLKNHKPFLKNDEYIRVPFSLIQEKSGYGVSYFVWRQFLNFCERFGLLKVKRMDMTFATHIQIQWFNLKSFAVHCLNRFATIIGDKVKNIIEKSPRQAKKPLIKVDLPEWFDNEHTELFERFLKVRYERQHKASNAKYQQEQLDTLTRMHNDGADTIEALRRAIVGNPKTMNGWDRIYDYRFHQERPEQKKWRRFSQDSFKHIKDFMLNSS